jgi:alkanesulfonate monooxygenase SsuD/methylene tetrahydromethanopterin reductase-like flavin-dependent oxidoreductase (luciferase family)
MKVGVGLPVGNHRGAGPAPYAAIRSMALQAEAIGLDSIWVYDHLLFRTPDLPESGAHEGWTLLAAVAAITDRVEVGMLVTGLRLRNPGLLAKMATTVDEVSRGRLILGVGAGWHDPELEAFGYPTDHRIGRFEEALQVLLPLIRTGTADFEGQWAIARNAVMLPAARPDIPILIAARGPRMLRLTARHADMSNLAWFASADDPLLAQRTAALDQACQADGRDPATLVRTVGVYIRLEGATTASPVRGQEGSPPITEDPEAVLRGFERAGFAHAVVWLDPIDEHSLGRLGAAVAGMRTAGG